MIKRYLLLLLCFFFIGVGAFAQTSVSGKVFDTSGSPMPGVSVAVKGTANGTITGGDGAFTLSKISSKSVLSFSFIGYQTQEVVVGNRRSINITLSEDAKTLSEVVVVGYGTQKRKDLTGSITQIDSKIVGVQNMSSVSKVLEGSVPGVNIASIDGQPGVDVGIRVRGLGSTSVGSSSALVVIDGVPALNDNPLSQINAQDIASITVLKDAASTAIYGSRGANGVVLVTTKSGQSGKTKISVQARWGVNTTSGFDVGSIDNAADYYQYVWKSIYNSYRYGVNSTGGPVKVNGAWTTNVNNPAHTSEEAGLFASQHLFNYTGSESSFGVNALGNYMSYNVPGAVYTADGTGRYHSSTMSGAYLIDPTTGKLNSAAKLLYDDQYKDYMLEAKSRQQYDITASGGSDKVRYYLSLGYLSDPACIPQSKYERYSGRAKVDATLYPWLKVGTNVALNRALTAYMGSNTWQARNAGASSGNYMQFIGASPILPVFMHNADGSYVYDSNGNKRSNYNDSNATYSPLGTVGDSNYGVDYANRDVPYMLEHDKRQDQTTTWSTRSYFDIPFLKYFDFRTDLSYDKINNVQTRYLNGKTGRAASVGGAFGKILNNTEILNVQTKLSYSQDFGKHHVDAMGLYEYNNWENELVQYGSSYELIPDFVSSSNFVGRFTTASGMVNPGYGHDIERMKSFLGRANYVFADKYYLSASIREDGSSKFKKNRWGTFWSVGGGWRFTEEDFMKDTKSWLDNGKLRASYGVIGNQNAIGRYSGYRTWGYGTTYKDVANGTGTPANYPTSTTLSVGGVVNDALTWEKTRTFDLGLDLTFINRIDVTIDWYNRVTGNSFFNQPVSYLAVGQSTLQQNIAKIRNRGIEIDINADVVRNKDWKWNVGLNLSHYSTILKDLPASAVPASSSSLPSGTWMANGESWSQAGGSGDTQPFYLRGIGRDWYNIYIHRYAGVDQNTGLPMYYHRVTADDVTAGTYGSAKQGDAVKTTDYTKSSQWEVGNAIPDLIGGFRTSLSYKSWELSANFAFQLGGKFYSQEYAQNLYKGTGEPGGSGISFADRLVSTEVVGNTWTPENKNAKFPIQWYPTSTTKYFNGTSANGGNWSFTDIALFTASYLRIKNITLSYTVPQSLLQQIHMGYVSGLKFFFSGDNVALFSAHKGVDPSLSASGGYEVGAFAFPNMQAFTFGINLDF
jgi:TonB-linked SusC/RagA family outer membrane protein